jgi:drug/metabolite transporter (DMT)-like permease
MDWILLSLVSACLLGFYDAAKKLSVRDNAVPVVLLCSVSIGAALYAPLIVWSAIAPETVPIDRLVVRPLDATRHGLVFAKSVLVGASWSFAFTALKHLPLSIAAPIRATSPFWTILIAIVAFGERPSPLQAVGMAVVLIGFWRFSLVGRSEGIRFGRDRAVYWMVIATLLGACSSLYDKWLLQYAGFEVATMQAWFTVYLVPVMVPLAVWWYRNDRPGAADRRRSAGRGGLPGGQAFRWRGAIAWVSPLLLLADWFYFVALSDPEAMVSVVSVVRRTSVVIALIFGVRALSEANLRAKLGCVALILAGVALLTCSS